MDDLPDEVAQLILSFLDPKDITALQSVSRRLLRLGRDRDTWKTLCFESSTNEASRQRNQLMNTYSPWMRELRDAVAGLPTRDTVGNQVGTSSEYVPSSQQLHNQETARAFHSWDPSRPGDKIDFYQEYIHRHGPITVDWLQDVDGLSTRPLSEAVGMAVLNDGSGRAQNVVAPLEDGSISVWNMSHGSDAGCVSARSKPGLLNGPELSLGANGPYSRYYTRSDALCNVSIDSQRRKAYFAMRDVLNEVDLETLQVVRRSRYPFPVSCLSEVDRSVPLTVGTVWTLHLHDTRDSCSATISSPEMASLSEPGLVSIAHSSQISSSHSIWVAGRFTSLLSYDRRFWPRIDTTIFSGGRLSSLIHIPRSYVPRDLDLTRNTASTISALTSAKSAPGATLIAAGQYKGKGSLELYGLSAAGMRISDYGGVQSYFQNRQTASRSRLLSVAMHGARLVFSDGNGIMTWVEPDGTSLVRTLNISEHLPRPKSEHRSRTPDSGYGSGASSPELWRQYATETTERASLFAETENSTGDIVQKIVPTHDNVGAQDYSSQNADDLVIWTEDGRLGNVGFRGRSAFSFNSDCAGDGRVEEGSQEEEMRLFEARMRRALERQADEVRFVRGLGL